MVDVEGGFLPSLRQSAILAAIFRALDDAVPERKTDVHTPRCLLPTETFGTHLQERQEFCQIDQPLGFAAFRIGQRLASVLSIQQFLKPHMYSIRHVETGKVVGYFDFKFDGLAHGGFLWL